jgi:hypothetical protein
MSEAEHRDAGSAVQAAASDRRPAAVSRRTVLAGAAATAALTLGGEAMGAETPPAVESDMVAFQKLSAALTGVAFNLLAPDTDSLDMSQVYFDFVSAKKLPAFTTLLQVTKDAKLQVPSAIPGIIVQADVDGLVHAIEAKGDDVKYLARGIVLMWYLGAWYEPADLAALAQDPEHFVGYTVVSSKAYVQGWLWRVAQAHPMGYSDMQFGYWTRKPDDLVNFIGTRPPKA